MKNVIKFSFIHNLGKILLHLALYIKQVVERQVDGDDRLMKFFSSLLHIKDFFSVILFIAIIIFFVLLYQIARTS